MGNLSFAITKSLKLPQGIYYAFNIWSLRTKVQSPVWTLIYARAYMSPTFTGIGTTITQLC
jgi:hypothetical protein